MASRRWNVHDPIRRVSFGLVGIVLVFAGVSKLVDVGGLRSALFAIGFSGHTAYAVAVGLVAAELACGAACLAGLWSRVLTFLLGTMFLGFTGVLILLQVRHGESSCGCFGAAFTSLGGESFPLAMTRNAFLVFLVAAPGLVRLGGRQSSRIRRSRFKSGKRVVPSLAFGPLVGFGALVAASGARADNADAIAPWHMGYEHPFTSSVTHPMIDEFIERFDPAEGDRADVALMLYEKHLERMLEFRKAHEDEVDLPRQRQAIRSLSNAGDSEARIKAMIPLAEREEQVAQIAEAQAALDERLLRELRALLTEAEQTDLWQPYLEWVNRRRWLRTQAFPGDDVNLLDIINRMEVTPDDLFIPSGEFHDLLHAYSSALDDAVVALRDAAVADARRTLRRELRRERANQPVKVYDDNGRHIDTVSADPAFHTEAGNRVKERNSLVRQLHETQTQYREMIAGRLRPARRAEFEERYYARAINRPAPPRAQGWIEALLAQEWIDSQRAAVLENMLEELARRWRAMLVEEHNTRVARAELRYYASGDEISGANDPNLLKQNDLDEQLFALGSERMSLDDNIMQRAWALFTPDERMTLPQPPLWRR